MDMPAGRGKTSGPMGVGCCNPKLVPAAWSDVPEPGPLLCGLGGIGKSCENPHRFRAEENSDINLIVWSQSVTNHSGWVTSSWVRGSPAHLWTCKIFLFTYSVYLFLVHISPTFAVCIQNLGRGFVSSSLWSLKNVYWYFSVFFVPTFWLKTLIWLNVSSTIGLSIFITPIKINAIVFT